MSRIVNAPERFSFASFAAARAWATSTVAVASGLLPQTQRYSMRAGLPLPVLPAAATMPSCGNPAYLVFSSSCEMKLTVVS